MIDNFILSNNLFYFLEFFEKTLRIFNDPKHHFISHFFIDVTREIIQSISEKFFYLSSGRLLLNLNLPVEMFFHLQNSSLQVTKRKRCLVNRMR